MTWRMNDFDQKAMWILLAGKNTATKYQMREIGIPNKRYQGVIDSSMLLIEIKTLEIHNILEIK